MYCDLHTHTTASDGDLTPLQLVDLALERGLAALGVTDHDTVAGLPPAMQAAKRAGLPFAWGIELSVDYQPATLHMLGYFIDIADKPLLEACERMKRSREIRNAAILDRLRELGKPIEREELLSAAGEDTVGRPHIADAMAAKGYVESRLEAFDRYIGKGGPAYVDRQRFTAEDAIALIRSAGGVAVLAHPFSTGHMGAELKAFISKLKDAGLQGIETHYWNHTADQQGWLSDLAASLDLLQSGGSDYHGPSRPETELGTGDGSLQVPFEYYDALRKAAGRFI